MTTTNRRLSRRLSFEDALAAYDPAMGLEVHVELNTATKMFCGCPATFGGEPNTQTCPTCLGLPGSMPVVNGKAVESAIRIGLALNCEIAEWCRFARKNYFYPDMPKNFQTSQYDEPIAFDGWTEVEVAGDDGVETFRVEIERAHMEEDTGKSLHVGGSTGRIHGAEYSLVDYNRAGIPLIEIVTKPITGAREKAPAVARAYVAHLRELLLGLGVSDVRMEQGSLRCDVNLSLAPAGSPSSAPAPRPRTSTRCVPSSGPHATRSAARRRSCRPAARCSRRRGTGTRTRASRRRAARSPTPRTTATSPSPTWCRSRLHVSGWPSCRSRCPSHRASTAPGSRRSGDSPTSRCATPSERAPCSWSRRPSPPAPHRRPPASGGSPSWPVAPTSRAPRSPRCRSPPPTSPGSRRSSTKGRSTTSWPARSSTECSPARARLTTSSPPAASRSSPTRAHSATRSTAPSRPTPTWPPRSATARSRLRVPSSARS